MLEKVRKDYVDGQNLTYQDLVYAALKGMLNTLDPHSEFMEPEKYKELQNDTQGAFGGLGIVVSMKDNFITVVAPMDDSPGFKAGIQSGDRIIRIDGKSTDKMSLQDAVKTLRGEPGTDVQITVFRPSSSQIKEYKFTRAVINVDMVKDINGKKEFPLGENKIGYVRLVQFGEKTSDDLETALQEARKEGMQGLILDLRWNPGGLLEQAVDVCEKFLPRGQLVVTTEGRNAARTPCAYGQRARRRTHGHADGGAGQPGQRQRLGNCGGLLAGCASAPSFSGSKSFGKGSVQSILPLPDGSALRLTTAKYYTPSHKVIHEARHHPGHSRPDQRRGGAGHSDCNDRPGAFESLRPKRSASACPTPMKRNSTAPWTCSKAFHFPTPLQPERESAVAARQPSLADRARKMAASK